MTGDQRRYLREVKELVRSHLGSSAEQIFLFGSWARDDIRDASDIDVAIVPGESFDDLKMSELSDALEESAVPYRVDLVNLDHADANFRARIMAEGILWTA